MKSVKSTGIRVGNWLSQRQAQALLSAPDITTVAGCAIAPFSPCFSAADCDVRKWRRLLRACPATRRTLVHCRSRRKTRRVRTAPMPAWVKVAIDAWTPPPSRHRPSIPPGKSRGSITGERLGEKVVWQMLEAYAAEIGVPDRPSRFATLCRIPDYAESSGAEAVRSGFQTPVRPRHPLVRSMRHSPAARQTTIRLNARACVGLAAFLGQREMKASARRSFDAFARPRDLKSTAAVTDKR